MFDPHIRRDITYGDFVSRGVSTWLDDEAAHDQPCRRTIYVANAESQLIALDAANGRPCADFGREGRSTSRHGLRIAPFEFQAYTMTSPPLAAMASWSSAPPSPTTAAWPRRAARCAAFDARTGALRWTFDPIPQDARDPAYRDLARRKLGAHTGAANVWSVIVGRPERDLVFLPTSPPGTRLLRRRCARATTATATRSWPCAPRRERSSGTSRPCTTTYGTTTTRHRPRWSRCHQGRRGGARGPAGHEDGHVVRAGSGDGRAALPGRGTRRSRAARSPGEETAPTQPFTAMTPPLSPHRYAADDAWGPTGGARLVPRDRSRPLRNEGIFTPPSLRGHAGRARQRRRRALGRPGGRSGAADRRRARQSHPGDRAAHPARGIRSRALPRGRRAPGHDAEYNMMVGTPYVLRRRVLLGPTGLPCSPPPCGTLVAVDLRTGQIRWETPLGSLTRPFGADMLARIKPDWGSPNLGGPIVTAGGVVFIGATIDRWLHAYDIETGRELWQGSLPEGGKATPMSYRLESGEQFVVIAVGGGDVWGAGDHLVAFRLHDNGAPPAVQQGRNR